MKHKPISNSLRACAFVALATLGSTASAQSLVTGSELNATVQTLSRLLQESREGAQQLESRVARVEQKLGIEVITPDENGVMAGSHKYVDLGIRLSDGTPVYWATENMGTFNTTATRFGRWYAWGALDGYTGGHMFDWSNYPFMQEGKEDLQYITKYTVDDQENQAIWYDAQRHFIGDGLTELLPDDDVVRQKWGGSWRMPTLEEMQLLIDQCDWTWVSIGSSAYGYRVTNRSDSSKRILLVAGGYWGGDEHQMATGSESVGYYWTSTLSSETYMAWSLFFQKGERYMDVMDRASGLFILPVCTPCK